MISVNKKQKISYISRLTVEIEYLLKLVSVKKYFEVIETYYGKIYINVYEKYVNMLWSK